MLVHSPCSSLFSDDIFCLIESSLLLLSWLPWHIAALRHLVVIIRPAFRAVLTLIFPPSLLLRRLVLIFLFFLFLLTLFFSLFPLFPFSLDRPQRPGAAGSGSHTRCGLSYASDQSAWHQVRGIVISWSRNSQEEGRRCRMNERTR